MPTDPYDVPMRDLTGRQIGKARVYTKSDGLSYAVPLTPETTPEPEAVARLRAFLDANTLDGRDRFDVVIEYSEGETSISTEDLRTVLDLVDPPRHLGFRQAGDTIHAQPGETLTWEE